MLELVLQLGIIGISMGMIYAFMSMGVILLVRSAGIMNFAQGDILMLGAYIFSTMLIQTQLPMGAAIIASILLMAVFAVIFMFSVYWPLKNASWPAVITISTLGASIIVKEGIKLIYGMIPKTVPPIVSGSIAIGSARLEYQYLIIIAIGIVAIVGIITLYDKLYAGRMMEAAAQNSYAARLIGIPTVLTTIITFCISFCLAGLGGYLVSPLFLVTTSLGNMQLKAFAGIVIGGFGNIKGAVFGSILVGLIESYSTFFTTTYKDAVVFLVLIVFLIFRPQGIYGEKIADKA